MEVGKSYVVYVYSDEETHRIAASSILNKFIERKPDHYKRGEQVELMISGKTDIGYSAVINHEDWGVIFYSDVVKPLNMGQKIRGFIKVIRDDGKIDLSLHAPGFAKVEDLSTRILKELHSNGGYLALSDKSPPEAIYDKFGISKKVYKTAIGTLYKKRIISIEKEGIHLLDNQTQSSS